MIGTGVGLVGTTAVTSEAGTVLMIIGIVGAVLITAMAPAGLSSRRVFATSARLTCVFM